MSSGNYVFPPCTVPVPTAPAPGLYKGGRGHGDSHFQDEWKGREGRTQPQAGDRVTASPPSVASPSSPPGQHPASTLPAPVSPFSPLGFLTGKKAPDFEVEGAGLGVHQAGLRSSFQVGEGLLLSPAASHSQEVELKGKDRF